MTRDQFLEDAEREYWMMFQGRGFTGEQIAAMSGLNRASIYRRYQQLGIPVAGAGSDAAWRSLAPQTAKMLASVTPRRSAPSVAPEETSISD